MPLQRVNYPFLTPPVGPYAHAVKHNSTLYLSGLTAFGTESQSAPIQDQAISIFQQLQNIADFEGIGLENLIKITAYVTDLSELVPIQQTLSEIYKTNLPASSLVHVSSLFSNEIHIEIEALFSLDD